MEGIWVTQLLIQHQEIHMLYIPELIDRYNVITLKNITFNLASQGGSCCWESTKWRLFRRRIDR